MISSQEVANKMKNANCFVLFSDYENQPCVILESFATGIPVIAPRVGGIPEIVEENRGILVEKADEKALFEAMKNVLEDKIAFEILRLSEVMLLIISLNKKLQNSFLKFIIKS
jgi:glycosyltransferase involved in cell wall biosynthesis